MQQKTKGKKMEKYQTLLNQLKELNEIDLKKNYSKDNYNMKLLLDGVQWQIDNYGKNKVL
mgnify:FL=1|tara:strand:+ start:232 stop:411 length:180 start_codon:yes stop_codon:yes gene_type:complete